MRYSLSEIAREFELELDGDPDLVITGVCGLSDNRSGCLSFVGDPRYADQAGSSSIAAFVTRPGAPVPGKSNLFHEHPEYMMARIASLFVPGSDGGDDAIHPSAVVDPSARIADGVRLGANVVIGADVAIASGCRLFQNVVIMDRVSMGPDCTVYPHCTIREDTILGRRVILQPGVTLGSDGFGFVQHEGRHVKIPHTGRVVLEDDVEVGANTAIDRARFSETRIGRGTKIDNLVHIAHNVTIGEDCLILGQVGISGSTAIGDRVVLAGQVGAVGHITVADDVTVLGKGGITKNVRESGVYAGMPLRPAKLWRKAIARLYAGLR